MIYGKVVMEWSTDCAGQPHKEIEAQVSLTSQAYEELKANICAALSKAIMDSSKPEGSRVSLG